MSKKHHFPPDVRVIEVISVEIAEGAGTEESPARRVIYYYDRQGSVLARVDKWEEEKAKGSQ